MSWWAGEITVLPNSGKTVAAGNSEKARTNKSVAFSAGAALISHLHNGGEIAMKRYIAWHRHNSVGDTLRDTRTTGWRHTVHVLACWARCDRQAVCTLFLVCCGQQLGRTSKSCGQTCIDRYIGTELLRIKLFATTASGKIGQINPSSIPTPPHPTQTSLIRGLTQLVTVSAIAIEL